MSSEVRHRVDHGQTYPLVRLTGVLDAHSAPEVRSALLDVLAGQPEAVVVEVSDLSLGYPDAAGVLGDLHRETADWPAARLVLCDSGDAGRWLSSGWPVWPDSARAFAELGTPREGRRVSVELEPQLGAARQTRELITEASARWDLAELAGPACIVATEMVNNVVAHAHTSMNVLLAVSDDGMSVAVRDHSAVVPSYSGGPVPPTAYGGRGMLLIDSVASRWGNLLLTDGKVVWALLATEDESQRSAPERPGGASMADPARG